MNMNRFLYCFRFLTSAAEISEEAADTGGISPVFLVIAGLAAVGILIMIVQNFVLKKEEYYK